MKRLTSLLLAVLLALACVCELAPAGFTAEAAQKKQLADYGLCETPFDLISTAEIALEDGADSKWVLSEINRYSGSGDFTNELQWTIENLLALNSKSFQTTAKAIGATVEDGEVVIGDNRAIDVTTPAAENYELDWDPYSVPQEDDSSSSFDKVKKLYKISNPQFCFKPAIWSESQFKQVFGTEYSKFKPAKARTGYTCVVIKSDAKCSPLRAWDKGDNSEFIEALLKNVEALAEQMGEDAPVLTGNPQLASTFWVFNVTYPRYASYGNGITGYHCEATLSVVNAVTKKIIGEVKYKNKLPDIIYSWNEDKTADPGIPDLSADSGFKSMAEKAVSFMNKERISSEADNKITAQNVERTLNGVLLQEAAKMSDPWEAAIYESGAQNVTLKGNTITFYMRAYAIGTSSIGKYANAKNKRTWLETALKNAGRYLLKQTLKLKDGKITSSSLKELQTSVKKYAKTAKNTFGGSDMANALKNYLFPAPVSGKVTKGSQLTSFTGNFKNALKAIEDIRPDELSNDALAALFYAQKKIKLDAKDGPHSIMIECTGVATDSLLANASKASLDKLANVESASRKTDRTSLEKTLISYLKVKAVTMKEKASNTFVLTLDIDELVKGIYPSEYKTFLERYTVQDTLDELEEKASLLPKQKASELPKNGIMNGGKSGTRVDIKLDKSSDPTYVQIRNASTDKLVASAFLRAGKTVSLKVPAGNYILYYCSGPYWYGKTVMFSSLGVYQKSEVQQIKNIKNKYTQLTLHSDGGNVKVYGADPNDFLGD
ncbi:MAG: hypothetical protein K5663_03185 [Clostridiales bacterium]|nr:hypothetical protein [Clostridiales bacterium]